MYKFWKEVTYEEFQALGLAGVHVCSTDKYQQLQDVDWPENHWHSLDYNSDEEDIVDPPNDGERFFVRVSTDEE